MDQIECNFDEYCSTTISRFFHHELFINYDVEVVHIHLQQQQQQQQQQQGQQQQQQQQQLCHGASKVDGVCVYLLNCCLAPSQLNCVFPRSVSVDLKTSNCQRWSQSRAHYSSYKCPSLLGIDSRVWVECRPWSQLNLDAADRLDPVINWMTPATNFHMGFICHA